MGCWYSRVEREESVSRCKSRRKYMKQLVQSRHAMSAAHSMYLRSLRSTGAALLRFSSAETRLHRYPPPPPPPPPHHHHHLPPMSPSTDTWTTSDSPPPRPDSTVTLLHRHRHRLTTTTTFLRCPPAPTRGPPPMPPPPPPPPASSSTWDFWYPFTAGASAGGGAEESDEWEAATTVTTATAAAAATAEGAARGMRVVHAPPPPPSSSVSSSELAMVVSRSNGKELVEIIKEVDEYLVKAADSGSHLSLLLEVPTSGFSSSSSHSSTKGGKVYNYGSGWGLGGSSSWSWGGSGLSPKRSNSGGGFGKMLMGNELVKSDLGSCVGGSGVVVNGSHCSTVERLYAWEKKLFEEVKRAETKKMDHEKKVARLKKLEMKRADYMKTEKTKKDVEKLESEMMVSSQAIETTSAEIIKLRETELYPQLLELVKGLMCMWRSMYEFHQVQKHIVQQLKYFNASPSSEPTSEIHRQSTLQLELEVQQWHMSFCNAVKAQQDYIQSLMGWLRLSLFQFNRNPLTRTTQDSKIYSLCEEWQLALDRIPDKVASEGIKSFLTVIHAIVVQQAEEHKQKKRAESVFRDFEKKAGELRSLESKHGPYSMADFTGAASKRNPVPKKRAKVQMLRAKAEEEKTKHEKSVSVTRAMTLNNLQMGLPHVFEGMVGFSSVCMHAFESVYNHTKGPEQDVDMKRLMP